ncbi:XTP/dITP diphosphatase [Pyrobaculum aerophilum]|uniref:dITP/XTP pyrophosphatase n=1 Tax=Pyrobaculum aerophilum TaxID=13773 RepID=A0A371QU25_9CREN|nr:XTP/dITP diphosphatase [Pyrobaculum aerophilum]RFA92383.1 non-canonical purine NTP pyrophosphatase, RdgB/HAM1 family [Pyrobaculum aerophilum]RFA94485.1 non-canonical purine NTP pyrophosphatase, RdgB/HAM1 family [Pyrobaculum aerophilum]
MRIRLATNNPYKLAEVSHILAPFGIEVERLDAEKVEIQHDDVVVIAREAAEFLCSRYGDFVVVDDTGLYIEALGGFPGPYAEYVYRTIGLKGVLKLLEGAADRRATFKCAAAICIGGRVEVFVGEVRGYIAHEPRGRGGFGYDPIFIPEGMTATYAELGEEVKNKISHRAKAFSQLGAWLTNKNLFK